MRRLILLATFVVAACSNSHGMVNEPDGGTTDSEVPADLDMVRDFGIDSGTDAGHCVATDTPPPNLGCFRASNHRCEDVVHPFECIDGEWQCPDWILEASDGTTCWCYGALRWGCFCTAMGVVCADWDGGVDGSIESDAGPAPFFCGESICDSSTQYCTHSLPNEAGETDSFYCSNYADIECSAHNCSCFEASPTTGTCEHSADGHLTLTLGGI